MKTSRSSQRTSAAWRRNGSVVPELFCQSMRWTTLRAPRCSRRIMMWPCSDSITPVSGKGSNRFYSCSRRSRGRWLLFCWVRLMTRRWFSGRMLLSLLTNIHPCLSAQRLTRLRKTNFRVRFQLRYRPFSLEALPPFWRILLRCLMRRER